LHATEKYACDFENRNAAYWSHSPRTVPPREIPPRCYLCYRFPGPGGANYSSRTAPTGVGSSAVAVLAAFSAAERRVRGVSKLN